MFNRHNAGDLKKELPSIKDKFNAWRDKGLVKFAGLTVHKTLPRCLMLPPTPGFYLRHARVSPKQVEELAPQRGKLHAKKTSPFSP